MFRAARVMIVSFFLHLMVHEHRPAHHEDMIGA
jgi:hypothetical protein